MDAINDRIAASMARFGLEGWMIEVFLTVFLTLLAAAFLKRFLGRLRRQFEKTTNPYDDALVASAERPMVWLVTVLGLCQAAEAAGAQAQVELFELVDPLRTLAVVSLVALWGVRFVQQVEARFLAGDAEDGPIDATTATAVGKLLRMSIIITAVLTAAQSLGFSIAGILAFGGVGGIAVGFAARDLLANFFGALMVFLDRPFSVGDWIRSPDQEIEGTVEHIGWRLTRIRTFDQRPLYVPNATFMSLTVENPSRMNNRRIYETIGVRYDDVAVLPAILEDIRAYLAGHEAIDHGRTLMVNFNAFGASSLDFFIYTFTRTTVWTEYHTIKEAILLDIAGIIDRHGAEIAFPTRTLHLAGPSPEPPLNP
jgi:MscS family membrane protein